MVTPVSAREGAGPPARVDPNPVSQSVDTTDEAKIVATVFDDASEPVDGTTIKVEAFRSTDQGLTFASAPVYADTDVTNDDLDDDGTATPEEVGAATFDYAYGSGPSSGALDHLAVCYDPAGDGCASVNPDGVLEYDLDDGFHWAAEVTWFVPGAPAEISLLPYTQSLSIAGTAQALLEANVYDNLGSPVAPPKTVRFQVFRDGDGDDVYEATAVMNKTDAIGNDKDDDNDDVAEQGHQATFDYPKPTTVAKDLVLACHESDGDGSCGSVSPEGFVEYDPDDIVSEAQVVWYDPTAPAPPTAQPASAGVGSGKSVTISLEAFDGNDDALTFSQATAPTAGNVTGFGGADCSAENVCTDTVTYTNTDATATGDSFTFDVSDGTATDTGTVSIKIFCGAIVTNGTVSLGVNCQGNLNTPGPPSAQGTGSFGLRFNATNNDGTAPGCLCEGWGVGDSISNVSGSANAAQAVTNMTVLDVQSDADSITSKVKVGDTFEVTHDYQPSATPNLYQVSVSVKNISSAATNLKYRRTMDWDVEPTAFSEMVTMVKGDSPQLTDTTNDGFASSDPLSPVTDKGHTGSWTDQGPSDHGALFQFDFGSLAAGSTKTFKTYYGAAGTETGALNALATVGAEAYSLGQTSDGASTGAPNTFIFGFGAVGGNSLFGPTADGKSYTVLEDSTNNALGLSGTSPTSTDLTFTPVSGQGPSHGTLGSVNSISCTGTTTKSCTASIPYTPNPDYFGPDSFKYTVSNGQTSSAATVNIDVKPVNDTPDAVNDTLVVLEDVAKVFDPRDNDSKGPSNESTQTLTIQPGSVGDPANGTATLITSGPDAGKVQYVSDADYNGPDSFTYQICDNGQSWSLGTSALFNDFKCDTATVNVDVKPVNDAPDAVNDNVVVLEDVAKVFDPRDNDTKGPSNESTQTLTIQSASVSNPPNGTATLIASGPDAGKVQYVSDADYNGPDSFTYQICDNGQSWSLGTSALFDDFKCDTATVNVDVKPVNDTPDAVNDTKTVAEDSGGTPIDVRANDNTGPSNESAQTLSVTPSSVTDPANGTASLITTGADAGKILYTPDANYNGSDSFTYEVCDNGQTWSLTTSSLFSEPKCDTATVNVTVTEVNDAPDAVNDAEQVLEDASATAINVRVNDSAGPSNESGQTLTVTGASISNPPNGTATLITSGADAGKIAYTPDANFFGSDSFTYQICDNGTTNGAADPKCDTATVTVEVKPVNDTPDAVGDTRTVDQDSSNNVIDVLANDTRGPNESFQTLTVTSGSVSDPAHGTATLITSGADAGKVSYTPDAGYKGSDSFTYQACDNGQSWVINALQDDPKCDTATVSITVSGGTPTATDYTGPASVQYSDVLGLSGKLTDITNGLPGIAVPGETLDFTFNTNDVGSATTNVSGVASVNHTVTAPAGAVNAKVDYAGNSTYEASTVTEQVTVALEDCTLSYTGGVFVPETGGSLTLKAVMGEPDTSLGDRSGKEVTFTLTDIDETGPVTRTFTATTGANGIATRVLTLPTELPVDVYLVTAKFTGDGFYKACTSVQEVVAIEAGKAKVTGGGWLGGVNDTSHFGFNVIPGATPKGQLELRGPGTKRFHGSAVTGLTVSGKTATWTGKGKWNGKAGYTFKATVTDNGTPGKGQDEFSITIKDGSNVVFSKSGVLKGGNIVVH